MAGGDGGFIRCLIQHLLVSWAVLLVAIMGMFGVVGVCEVPSLVGLENRKLVGRVWVRVEEGDEVDVRDCRSLRFSTEFGASATQFD